MNSDLKKHCLGGKFMSHQLFDYLTDFSKSYEDVSKFT